MNRKPIPTTCWPVQGVQIVGTAQSRKKKRGGGVRVSRRTPLFERPEQPNNMVIGKVAKISR